MLEYIYIYIYIYIHSLTSGQLSHERNLKSVQNFEEQYFINVYDYTPNQRLALLCIQIVNSLRLRVVA